jgi:hypothetical protein
VATPVCGLRYTTPVSEPTPPPPLSARWKARERDAAAREDLTGGESYVARGSWSTRSAYLGFLGLLGSEGARTGRWTLREAIAGVGAAASVRRRCWRPNPRRGADAREGRRAQGCARTSGNLCRRAGLGSRRGVAVVHGGARLGAMGGGEHGARGWLARTRRGLGGVFRATEDVASPPLGDRARDPHGHGGVTAARPSYARRRATA